MNIDELTTSLAQLKTVTLVPAARAFVERVPGRKAFHFFRPFADDLVHCTSMRNTSEQNAVALAVEVLDTLGARWSEVGEREVTKLVPWTAGPSFADALIVLGRGIANMSVPGAYFLPSRTVSAFPIHHMEFTGEETAAEATVRKKDAHLNDMTRTPSPIVFCRYQLASGGGSAKHFAVGSATTVLSILRDVVREGGRLEFENYQRQGCLFTTTAGSGRIDAQLDGVERVLTHEGAVQLVHTLTTKDFKAARAELG